MFWRYILKEFVDAHIAELKMSNLCPIPEIVRILGRGFPGDTRQGQLLDRRKAIRIVVIARLYETTMATT